MARYSPGYFRRINRDPRGAVEIKRLEIGDVTLSISREMATQVLGRQLQWRGATNTFAATAEHIGSPRLAERVAALRPPKP